jgi:YD repeat-containing protein
VSPDPDGAGALKHRVTRTVYNPAGQPARTEAGTATGQSDAHIDAALVLEASETDYDSAGRPVTERTIGNGTVQAVTQQSYDVLGRPKCTAVRMDPASFGSLPGACAQTGTGSDLISETVHNDAGELTELRSAVGTALQSADQLSTYTPNGRLLTLTDGENNKTTYEYDGHDRLSKTFFPSPTKGSGTSSATDYEQFTYDSASNVTARRLRDGNSIGFGFDNLNRMTSKTRPNSEGNATYGYDSLGRMISNVDLGKTLAFTWDALGRQLTEVNRWGTTSSTFDAAGRRTRLQHPDGFYVDYDHLVTGETWKVRENGATSGVGVLATYAYDDLGRGSSLTRGNGTVKSYGYDNVSRTASLGEDLAGTANDLALSFTYDPASRIASTTRSNDAYAWTGHYNLNRAYASNGLNQYTASGSVTPTYDARGNLTSAGATTYGYTSDNLLFKGRGGRRQL